MFDLDPTTGYLTRGRHQTTEADVRARFIDHPDFATSTTRSTVWADYETGRDILRAEVRVHAVWLGGSFLTAKMNPNDVDALFIVSARDIHRGGATVQTIVNAFAGPSSGPGGTVVRGHGLPHLDSYVLPWQPHVPFVPLGPTAPPDHTIYAALRGYWDDWWQRDRHSPGGSMHWKDSLPRRGFLEVELDDFTR